MNSPDTLESVRQYYGEVLTSSRDLKTSACCSAESLPAHVRGLVQHVHPEVQERFYGCGSPIPVEVEGRTVLDLGCGAGRDVYLLSQLVGARGNVIGVDATPAQLAVARRHQAWHAARFGHGASNVTFVDGAIEDLSAAGIADASVDVVVSNCVLNLSPDKARVFREAFRVLKPGGELFFSDIVADRRVPAAWSKDPVLLGECLGGALYREDLRRLLAEAGCPDARTVSATPVALGDEAIRQTVGNVRFTSVTVRAFKLDLEDRCEDFGQVATYLGTLQGHAARFHARRPPHLRDGAADARLRQHRRHARCDPLRAPRAHPGCEGDALRALRLRQPRCKRRASQRRRLLLSARRPLRPVKGA